MKEKGKNERNRETEVGRRKEGERRGKCTREWKWKWKWERS